MGILKSILAKLGPLILYPVVESVVTGVSAAIRLKIEKWKNGKVKEATESAKTQEERDKAAADAIKRS